MIDWDELTKRFAEYAATVTPDQYFAEMDKANPGLPPFREILERPDAHTGCHLRASCTST